jgi:proton-conducting membrane transporter
VAEQPVPGTIGWSNIQGSVVLPLNRYGDAVPFNSMPGPFRPRWNGVEMYKPYQNGVPHLPAPIDMKDTLLNLAAPFHFWSPDVYDAIPTIVTTFVAIIAKISIFIFLLELV